MVSAKKTEPKPVAQPNKAIASLLLLTGPAALNIMRSLNNGTGFFHRCLFCALLVSGRVTQSTLQVIDAVLNFAICFAITRR